MMLKSIVVIASGLVSPASVLAGGAEAFDKSMGPILENYLTIHSALAGDNLKRVKEAANAIVDAAKKLDPRSVTGAHAQHYKDLPAKLGKSAGAVAAAGNMAEVRKAFKTLSRPMAMWGSMSKPTGMVVMFCSMAKASWLQRKGETLNPYFGSEMLGCGEVVGGDTGKTGHTGRPQTKKSR